MCVYVCVAFEQRWVQLGLIRVQSIPLQLSQTQLSFNMPFPAWISLSHVTEFDAHISLSHPFPFLMSPFSSVLHPLCVPLCDVAPSAVPSPPPPSVPSLSLIHCQVHLLLFCQSLRVFELTPAQRYYEYYPLSILKHSNTFRVRDGRNCSTGEIEGRWLQE